MPIIVGIERSQISFLSLETLISKDNKTHFIGVFVDKFLFKTIGYFKDVILIVQ